MKNSCQQTCISCGKVYKKLGWLVKHFEKLHPDNPKSALKHIFISVESFNENMKAMDDEAVQFLKTPISSWIK